MAKQNSFVRVARGSRGFTVIELLVVIAIIGILVKISYPRLTFLMEHYRLDGAARKLMADIQKARFRAISERKCFQVKFDSPVPTGYFLVQNGPANIACRNTTYADDGVSQQIDSSNGVTVSTSGGGLGTGGGNPVFDTHGAANITSDITITLTNRRGAQRRIVVSSTGRVRIT